jgi:hypothetical protein
MTTTMTATDLAMSFRRHAEKKGNFLALTARQVGFLAALARRDTSIVPAVRRVDMPAGATWLCFFPDGDTWSVTETPKGAGTFRREVLSGALSSNS